MERREIAVCGVVQGVGFRPFVYGLASRMGLAGFVRNEMGNVRVEVEGEPEALERFIEELVTRPPPLARIESLRWQKQPLRGETGFAIGASEAGFASSVFICPDVATCDDCLVELFDPTDRRYRYPFINCTNCGPRLTIVKGAPYDRRRTTMARFEMCPACRREYEDPRDRRFHAQPTACHDCGPRLSLLNGQGEIIHSDNPLSGLIAALRDGKIAAIKGLGGYHLACLAQSPGVVCELRRRKRRDEKPFAVMVSDAAAARTLCEINEHELRLLVSPPRPIVLLRKRPNCPVADQIAPGNLFLGVMLPYTPVHHLLMHDIGQTPLVMTSGNRSDEPIAYDDADALERLRGIADVFLVHDRPIHVRCDDSVTRMMAGDESPVRRSRGYAPQPVALPAACPKPMLAVGGQLKNTFALGRDHQAFLSYHLGDLDHLPAFAAFERDITLYEELLAIHPRWVVHDLHPDYASTHYAQRRCERDGLQSLAVQHHHAHMAACMAEHRLPGPVIGVSFDGTGYGTDGAVWGGEFLVGDYLDYERAAHLRYVRLPGGDSAIHEPWRMALAHLRDARADASSIEKRIDRSAFAVVSKMIEHGFNAPNTSSAGRLFDAVASLAGVRDVVHYEAQAAMELEWLATSAPIDGSYPFAFEPNSSGSIIDTRPMITAITADAAKGVNTATIARRFHTMLVELIAATCGRIRSQRQINDIVLGGGVFLNALLTTETIGRLTSDGFRVYRYRLVPTNDGGLSLGQLAVAAARLARASKE